MADPIRIPGDIRSDRETDSVINTPVEPNEIKREEVDGPFMEAVEPTFLQSIGDRIPQVSTVRAFGNRFEIEQAKERGVDLAQDPEALYNRLEREGLLEMMTPQDLEEFADIETTAEFNVKARQLTERRMSEQQLAEFGFVGQLIGEAAAYSADPATLLVDSLAGGSARGARMARFLSGGARATAANALIDATLTVDERTYTPAEIGFTVAASFGLGGAFGVAFGRNVDSTVTPNRSVPFQDKHPDLDGALGKAVIPKWFYQDVDPAIRNTADQVSPEDIRRSADPADPKYPQAERPASSRVDADAGPDLAVDGIDPTLKARADRLLSDDELVKAQQTVDDLSVVENPTRAQEIQLDQATKRLDDHEDAKVALEELEASRPEALQRVEDIPAAKRQFEGIEFVKEALEQHRIDLRQNRPADDAQADTPDVVDPAVRQTDNADEVVNDTPESRSIGAAQADVVLFHDTAFGIHSKYADPVVDSLAPDVQPGDYGIVSQLLMRMTPATRARVLNNFHARVLASRMFTNPWTVDGDEFNPTGWEDTAARFMRGPEGIRMKKHRQAFDEWFEDTYKTKRRFNKPRFWRFAEEAEFAQQVGSAIQTLRAGQTPDVHPAVLKAAEAFDEFAETHWAQLQRSGVVPEDIPRPYKYYLPQIVDRSAVREFLNSQFSDKTVAIDALAQLYAKAMDVQLKARIRELAEEADDGTIRPETQKQLDKLEASLKKVISQAYARRAYSQDLSAKGMTDTDAIGLHLENVAELRKLLEDNLVRRDPNGEASARLTPEQQKMQAEIDEIINSLTKRQSKKGDQSVPNRLKKRMDLDMDAQLSYKNKFGETKTIRLGDLYEKDVNHLAHNYGRWAAAEATLARDGTSIFEVAKAIDELEVQSKDSTWNPEAPKPKDIELLQYGFRAVMNLPAHDNKEALMRASNALKNLTYAARMGAAFTHSFSEAWTIAAQMGVKDTLKEIPTLRKIIKNYATGKVDPGLQEELYALNGAVMNSLEISLGGSRFDTDYSRASDYKALDVLEKAGEGFKRSLSVLNLLPATTDITRQFATVMQLRQLDKALRGEKMPKFWDGIRRQYGLSDSDMANLRKHFLSDSVTRNSDGTIDWDGSLGLNDMPAETRLALEDFLYRSATTAIQEVHRGNLPMFMTGPIGSLVLQFRSFEIAATTRHLAADVSRADSLALNKFVGSSLIAGLGYTARTYLFSGGDQEVLEERLQLDRVIANSIAYSVSAGAIPAVVDTMSYHLTGGFTPFNRYRTTGMSDTLTADTFGVGSAPAYGLLEDAMTASSILLQAPWDIASGEKPQVSRQQMRALFTIVGADTLWFLRPGKEYVLAQMPKESEIERGNILTAIGIEEE